MSIDDLMYYLPEVLVIAAIAAVLIWGFFFVRSMLRSKRGEATCRACKGIAERDFRYNEEYLFALPVAFGDRYENAERYLPAHMVPIADKTQIPLGRRACRVKVYRCTQCENRQAEVVDFLQVRGEEYEKGRYEMDLELLRPLLEDWEQMKRDIS